MAAPPSSMRPPPPTDDTGLPPSSSTSSTATAPPRGGGTTHPPTDPLSSPAIQLYKNTTDQGISERGSQNALKTHGSAMTDRRQKREGSFGSFDSLARGCESFYRAGPASAFPQLSHVPGIRQTPVNTKQEIHVACAENTNAHVHKSTTTMIK